jgi:arylsulfatase
MNRIARMLLLPLVSGVLIQCDDSQPAPPTSIILITVDTLRADHLSCYGYFRETSPVMDALAADGILFERAYAPMSTTLPSHISLMTSLNPLQHGVLGNFRHLRATLNTSGGITTVAQFLGRSGYATAGFISATPLKSHSGIEAGFDTYDGPEGYLRPAEETTDLALAWLAETDSRPVFLWVHYFDPHDPYLPPPEFVDTYTTDAGLREFLERKRVYATETVLKNNNDYDGSIRYLDTQLGRLLSELKAKGLYDDAAIVLTADHGEGLGEHGWMDHGPIYDEDLHVPLILKLPQAINRPGERRDGLAALIDVLPTLTAALELPITDAEQARFSGVDLLGSGPSRRYVFSQRVVRKRRWGDGLKFSLTGARWKYFHLTEGEDELYDLLEDPEETKNVITVQADVAAEMERALLGTIKAYGRARQGDGEDPVLPPEVMAELEALGYVR